MNILNRSLYVLIGVATLWIDNLVVTSSEYFYYAILSAMNNEFAEISLLGLNLEACLWRQRNF